MYKRSTSSNGPEIVHTIPGDSVLTRDFSSRLRQETGKGDVNNSSGRRSNPYELYEISSVLKPVPGYEKPWEMAPPKYWGQLRQLFIEESLKKRQMLDDDENERLTRIGGNRDHQNQTSSSLNNSSAFSSSRTSSSSSSSSSSSNGAGNVCASGASCSSSSSGSSSSGPSGSICSNNNLNNNIRK